MPSDYFRWGADLFRWSTDRFLWNFQHATDASLSSLSITDVTLLPSFQSAVRAYTAATTIASGTTTVTVSATATDPNATITGTGVVTLNVGENTISVMVTAADGVTTQTYSVAVFLQVAPTTFATGVAIDADVQDALWGRTTGLVRFDFRYYHVVPGRGTIRDISDAVIGSATLKCDINRAVTRSASLQILHDRLPSYFDPLSSHLRIVMRLLVPTGSGPEWVELDLGTFRLDVNDERYTPAGARILDVSASDLTIYLVEGKSQGPYSVPSGTTYIGAVRDLINAIAAPIPTDLPEFASVLPIDATWPPGTSYYAIARDLLSGVGYRPLYALRGGAVTTTPWAIDQAAVTYREGEGPRMVKRDEIARRNDRHQSPKRVTAFVDDPRSALKGTRETRQIASGFLSPAQRGVTNQAASIGGNSRPLSTRCVADAATLGTLAEWALQDSASRADQLNLTTLLDPRLEAHATIGVELDGVDAETWRSLIWTMTLSQDGAMRHTLGNATAVQTVEV